MKSFLKTVLACVVAILLAGLISTIFYTCSFVGMMSALSSTETVATKPNDVLVLKINSMVNEVESSMPFTFDMMGGFTMNDGSSLRQICQAIDLAKNDDNIVGIYLNTDNMTAAPASYEIIRDYLEEFKAAGKWIIAYNDSYSSANQYYLASVADSVFVNPIGTITFDGMSTSIPYYKELFDKLGVEMQIFRVGTFKSAVEPYMLNEMSEANRLQTECYMCSMWDFMVSEISESRGISVDSLNALANQGVSYMLPQEMLATGLVTRACYWTDVEAVIEQKTGQDFHGVTVKQMCSTAKPSDKKDEVAVLYAVGEIVSSENEAQDQIWWKSICKELKKLQEDDDVKAIVLRVNSPGGSAFASEQMWKSIMDVKAAGKPVVVSMGDYAASGGYYISAPADYIFASHTTITGSIGVFGMIPNAGGLVTGKLGVNFEEVKTHKFGTVTPFRGVTDAERAQVQRGVENFYDIFLTRCSDGRGMPKDSIAMIAEGRVWTGEYGVQNGLVDELGGLPQAIAKAAELAGLAEGSYTAKNYPSKEESLEAMLKMFSDEATISIAHRVLGTDAVGLRFIENLKDADRIQARMVETMLY